MKLVIPVIVSVLIASGATVSAEDISIVVYNSDLGLVKQPVELNLTQGVQTMVFSDVSERIDPTSVRLDLRGGARLLEQDFRFDLLSTDQMLRKNLNKTVTAWLKGGNPLQGTLLSSGGDIIIKDASGKVNVLRAEAVERIEFPDLPAGLANRPALHWKLDASRAGKAVGTAAYLTGGLTWHAEYSAVVNDRENAMDFSSFVSIDNSSGRSYENAALKLVAGSVHRVEAPVPAPVFRAEKSVMMAAGAADQANEFGGREISEYHLYDLKGKTTLADGGSKQIAFIDPVEVKVERKFVFDSAKNRNDVATVLEFVNSENAGPNVPLPAGKVRVFRKDTDGSSVLIGEDSIGHTPKGEKVRLTLGAAFDLKAERKVTEARSISQRVNEQSFEISIRNRKTEQVSVTIIERLHGDWEIVQKSHPFTKKDASTAEFEIKAPAGGETTVSYTARFRY